MIRNALSSKFNPLRIKPILLLDTEHVTSANKSIPIMTVRRPGEGDEVDIYGYDPANPRHYQTSAGGAYETTIIYPAETFYDVEEKDQSGNGNDAPQITAGSQPQVIWPPLTYGAILSSGSLTVGKDYEITDRTGADFTTDGSPDNVVGTVFAATGTNVTLDADDTAREVLTFDFPVLKYDGIDDFFDLAGLTHGASNYTFFIRLEQPLPGGSNAYIFDTETGRLLVRYPANSVNTIGYTYPAVNVATPLTKATFFNASIVLESPASSIIYDNITPIASGLTYVQTAIGDRVKLGSTFTATNNFNGKMKSLIIYDRALTTSQIEALNAYYSTFFGASQADIDALIAIYGATDGGGWTDNTGWLSDPYVGNWFGVTVTGGNVSSISLATNNMTGPVDLTGFEALQTAVLSNNSLTSIDANGTGIVSLTASTAGITTTNLAGCTSLQTLNFSFCSLTDLSGVEECIALVTLLAQSNSIASPIDTSAMPNLSNYRVSSNASLAIGGVTANGALTFLYVQTTATGALDLSNNDALRSALMQDMGLIESEVDSTIDTIYANRASYTWATPNLNIGGSNADPSGVYQYSATPTTGLEKVYALINDDDAEGFSKWTITY